eukprot:334135-Pelagomonas_calceolata.AAC.1
MAAPACEHECTSRSMRRTYTELAEILYVENKGSKDKCMQGQTHKSEGAQLICFPRRSAYK